MTDIITLIILLMLIIFVIEGIYRKSIKNVNKAFVRN